MTRDEELSAILQQNRRLREDLQEARTWAIRMRDERDALEAELAKRAVGVWMNGQKLAGHDVDEYYRDERGE